MSVKKTKLLVTHRALGDIAEIEAYSISEWGKRVALKYIADLEQALSRLRENPSLLRPEPEFHPELAFYRVGKHLLVCDTHPDAIYLLTVIHTSRDIPSRLAELAPTLSIEVEMLRRQLRK